MLKYVIPTLPEGSEVFDAGVGGRTDSVVACVRQLPASERQIPPPFDVLRMYCGRNNGVVCVGRRTQASGFELGPWSRSGHLVAYAAPRGRVCHGV